MRKALAKDSEWALSLEVPIGYGLVGRAAESRQHMLVNDLPNDLHFHPRYDTAGEHAIHSTMAVPLIIKDALIGVIQAINKLDGPFTQDDLDLLLLYGRCGRRCPR